MGVSIHKRANGVRFLLVAVIFGVMGCPQAAHAQQISSTDIEQRIVEGRGSQAFWSVMVRSMDGEVLVDYNSEKLIRPASNMKLFTSAAVLDELGPDFVYKTRLYGSGVQDGATWRGNIIFRGAGDPSMSGRFYNRDRLHVLNEFYSMLRSRGITSVSGNLIGNDAYFDSKPYPEGWSWDDFPFYYAAPTSALSFNNNTVDLTVYASGGVGDTPRIEWFPFDTDFVTFVNEQLIAPASAGFDENYDRLLGTNTIILRSTLPKGHVEKEALTIAEPSRYFLDTFKKYAQDGGISFEKDFVVVNDTPREWDDASLQLLGTHQSPPLKTLLKELNKESNNFYAEMLLKTAAAERYRTTGTTNLGVALITDFAKQMGIDNAGLSFSDGSGLSATTLLSTNALTQLLVKMRSHVDYQTYKNSLAVGGIDGSLSHRFGGTPLINKVWGKTGYISGVRALSGYLQTQSGQLVAFSMAANNYTMATYRIDAIHETLLELIYRSF